MTYDVLKDYDDIVKYPISDSKETRDVTVLSLKVGEIFIPAETHYPQNKVDRLVTDGTIRLKTKPVPAEKPEVAPKPEPAKVTT